MRIDLYASFVPADHLVPVAVEAEKLGFDGINVPDHVIYPMHYSSPYSLAEDGGTSRAPWDQEQDWPDPFVIAAAIVSATARLKVMTGVLVLPIRHPLLVAKAAATIDAVAPGRFELGIGVGWLEEEFAALEEEFASRGPRTDEAIEVLRKAWSPTTGDHAGEFFSFEDLAMRPLPSRSIPIHVGGGSKPALRRAARLGDGFFPRPQDTPRIGEHVAELARLREEAGTAERPFEVIAAASGYTAAADFERLHELGVTGAYVDVFGPLAANDDSGSPMPNPGDVPLERRLEALRRYHEEVLTPLRERLPSTTAKES